MVSLIVSNGILSSVIHYFLQFNSVLIIIELVLVLVLGLEGLVLVLVLEVLVNITAAKYPQAFVDSPTASFTKQYNLVPFTFCLLQLSSLSNAAYVQGVT